MPKTLRVMAVWSRSGALPLKSEHAPKIMSKEFDIYDKDRKQVTEIVRLMSKVAGGARSDIVLAALAQIGSQLIDNAEISADSAP